jgi:tetratricopeptide (TPR) repeat protein
MPEREKNQRLKAARKALRLSQVRLAEKLEEFARANGTPDFACYARKIQYWEDGTPPIDHALGVLEGFFAQYGYTLSDLGLEPAPTPVCTSRHSAPTVSGGGTPSNAPVREDEVKRRQFTASVVALVGLPEAATPTFASAAPIVPAVPSKIGPAAIAQVRDWSRVTKQMDYAHGGAAVRRMVVPELGHCAELLKQSCPASLRGGLFGAVAEFAEVSGYALLDTYDHAGARQAFSFGLSCAQQAEDWGMRAEILTDMSRQALWLGNEDEALTYVDLALVRSDRLSATEQAKTHAARAAALARLGMADQAFRAVEAADEAFARRKPTEEPEWLAYYTSAQHCASTAGALYELEMQGHTTQARSRYHDAAANYGATRVRAQAMVELKLANLTMATGDPHEAAALGNRALATAERINSRRALEHARELSRSAEAHASLPDVTELRERITSFIHT